MRELRELGNEVKQIVLQSGVNGFGEEVMKQVVVVLEESKIAPPVVKRKEIKWGRWLNLIVFLGLTWMFGISVKDIVTRTCVDHYIPPVQPVVKKKNRDIPATQITRAECFSANTLSINSLLCWSDGIRTVGSPYAPF